MAEEIGLSVERVEHISKHTALVGNILMVWLDNLHWKERLIFWKRRLY